MGHDAGTPSVLGWTVCAPPQTVRALGPLVWGVGVEPLTCDLAPLRGKLRDAAFAAAVLAELDVN